MFEDEGNVPRRVEIWDKLHVVSQAVIGEFLQLRRGERLRLNQCGGALELEVALELDHEAVDLEEGGLTNRALQLVEPIEMMRVVPVELPQTEIGPVDNAAFWEPRSEERRVGKEGRSR